MLVYDHVALRNYIVSVWKMKQKTNLNLHVKAILNVILVQWNLVQDVNQRYQSYSTLRILSSKTIAKPLFHDQNLRVRGMYDFFNHNGMDFII